MINHTASAKNATIGSLFCFVFVFVFVFSDQNVSTKHAKQILKAI